MNELIGWRIYTHIVGSDSSRCILLDSRLVKIIRQNSNTSNTVPVRYMVNLLGRFSPNVLEDRTNTGPRQVKLNFSSRSLKYSTYSDPYPVNNNNKSYKKFTTLRPMRWEASKFMEENRFVARKQLPGSAWVNLICYAVHREWRLTFQLEWNTQLFVRHHRTVHHKHSPSQIKKCIYKVIVVALVWIWIMSFRIRKHSWIQKRRTGPLTNNESHEESGWQVGIQSKKRCVSLNHENFNFITWKAGYFGSGSAWKGG